MKKLSSLLDHIFGRAFVTIASISSVLGFVIIVFTDEHKALIALIALVVFLLAILLKTFHFFNSYLNHKTERGYSNLATNSRYYTNDGNFVVYETHKYIVCKQTIMNSHEHHYVWSGTHKPVVSSETMDVVANIQTEDGKFDKIVFRFKEALTYNDFMILHIKMEIDDSDHRSEPYLEHFVRDNLQLLSFNVELKHKTAGKMHDARLLKKRLDTEISVPYELIKTIPFDNSTCTYEYNYYRPQSGYSYKLEWDR